MRILMLIAALGSFASTAAGTTLVCFGRVTESTIPAQKVGDTATDTYLVNDETRMVTSGGKPQPLTKFSAREIEITKVGPKARATISISRVNGAYALRVAGEDSPVRLTVLGECHDPSAVARGERIGSITNSAYTSPSLGIALTIPAGWEANHDELEKRLTSLPLELTRRTVLTLAKLDKDRNPQAMLLISAEKVVGELAAKDYVEAGRAVSRQRPGVTAVSEVAMERIGNVEFATSTVTMGSGKDATFMKTYARRHRDNMLMVVLWYAGSRQRYESEQLLGSIQYK